MMFIVRKKRIVLVTRVCRVRILVNLPLIIELTKKAVRPKNKHVIGKGAKKDLLSTSKTKIQKIKTVIRARSAGSSGPKLIPVIIQGMISTITAIEFRLEKIFLPLAIRMQQITDRLNRVKLIK